jgi:hypothetical protein
MSQLEQQRALKQSYRDNPVPSGVFAIRHLATGRVLLGASANLDGALNRHRFELRMGGHRNRALQADWLAGGEAAFSFEVVDTVKARPDDPSFDREAELAVLFELWSHEYASRGTPRYGAPQRTGSKP